MNIKKIVLEDKELEITSAKLLSIDEAENYLTQDERKYSHRYWLCWSSYYYKSVPFVYEDGNIYEHGIEVDYCIYVRPALQISNLKSSNLKVGDLFIINNHRFKVISPTLAWLYDSDIGFCEFRRNFRARDSSDYDKSDVKEYIDSWWNGISSSH